MVDFLVSISVWNSVTSLQLTFVYSVRWDILVKRIVIAYSSTQWIYEHFES